MATGELRHTSEKPNPCSFGFFLKKKNEVCALLFASDSLPKLAPPLRGSPRGAPWRCGSAVSSTNVVLQPGADGALTTTTFSGTIFSRGLVTHFVSPARPL